MYVGRYAPSTTGRLHLGNLRTALLAWLHARLNNGEFLLRFDDLDNPRVVEGSAQQIIADLQWLGLDWDGDIYYQSENYHCYEKAIEKLQNQSRLYPCFCSRKDIQQAISAPHGQLAVYSGACRDLSNEQRIQKSILKTPAIRYRVKDKKITFIDSILGSHTESLVESCGDFVVKRADGLFAYQLAVVIDDIEQGINTVVRGADLLDSTARQIVLFEQFNHALPTYVHVPLLLNDKGTRMAKRDGSDSIAVWQNANKTAQQLLAYLANSVGLLDEVQECSSQELLQSLNVAMLEKSLTQVSTNQFP